MTEMIERGDRFPYGAGSRQVRGVLRYPEAPDPGQIIGPDGMGELCVVLGTIEDRTYVGLAIAPDFEPHVQGNA